jgi:alcohol dehydrogenase (cytochrome c)
VFARGASDWALYRSVRRGIPGTAMRPHAWPANDIWQVVAYVRSLDRSRTTTATGNRASAAPVTYADLVAAERDSADWRTYSGSYASHRYSHLRQIDRGSVSRLRLRWIYQLPMQSEERVEASPIAVANELYVTVPPNDVVAIDRRTGGLLWRYNRPLPDHLPTCCGRVNRGVAVLGKTVYLATLDARLVALDAASGKITWEAIVADPAEGYTITAAPLALDGLIITGVAGGEYGIRGMLDAYDATTGKRVWRFHTIPGPGEPGHETWTGDSWRRGGGPTWLTGSYDPDLGLLYWGTGNPGPVFDATVRPGDNLYTNSVLALEASTGKLRWHFQFTPNDAFDYDAVEIPVLVDADVAGRQRRLLVTANRNGFYYVLDRVTGQFLAGRSFARVTWAQGLDSAGRPVPTPGAVPSPQGTLVYPSDGGATNWWSPAFSPRTNLFYVAAVEKPGLFYSSPSKYRPGMEYAGGDAADVPGRRAVAVVRALSATTGILRWEHVLPVPDGNPGGVLATAGDLVFGGDVSRFYALDAETGRELWWFNTGGRIAAAPVAYLVDGREQISVIAGRALLTFSLDGR